MGKGATFWGRPKPRVIMLAIVFVLASVVLNCVSWANLTPGVPGQNTDLGAALPLYSGIPFVGMLLSIALMPLFWSRFWRHHFGKVSAFWVLATAIPMLAIYRGAALHQFVHTIVVDYMPFIILLWSLFAVSGGILIQGTPRGTPVTNTLMLTAGTLLASVMGTTGAAMLMIRPFLRANRHRKNRGFMVVFFIFLVANVGGTLTPLGDPPLFLGFLHRVPFTWTFNLLPQMLTVAVAVLVVYLVMDTYMYKKEKTTAPVCENNREVLRLDGRFNFILLAGIIGAVLMSGLVEWGSASMFGIARPVADTVRDAILILMGVLSLAVTPRRVREDNEFTWVPIREVAYLFFGIFISMAPCLLVLKAGNKGALSPLIETLKEPAHYFWAAGIASSFLDNAPAYLTFFSTALGKFYPNMPETQAVPRLIAENSIYLKAICCGCVFMGANTYIGNAPNFMIRSIAEEAGTPMPGFFGYMIKYSIPILGPIFVIVSLVFFS